MTQGDRSALEGFFAELRRVWDEAGPPSYKEFEKLSKRVKGPADGEAQWLSRSTTQHILAGRRRKPPRWQWVSRFIIVLREAAKEVGVDPARIGDLPEWNLVPDGLGAYLSLEAAARLIRTYDATLVPGCCRPRHMPMR